jgi:hypothetical protein
VPFDRRGDDLFDLSEIGDLMEIVTSWMEEGIKQGKQHEARSLILGQLRKRLGSLEPQTKARIEALSIERLEHLSESLLDFASPADLTNWLDAQAGRHRGSRIEDRGLRSGRIVDC